MRAYNTILFLLILLTVTAKLLILRLRQIS